MIQKKKKKNTKKTTKLMSIYEENESKKYIYISIYIYRIKIIQHEP